MGWTGVYNGRMTSKEKKEYLDKEYTFKDNVVIKSAMVGSTYYCAVRKSNGVVWAGVCLTQMHRDGEFRYKDMDETEGPYAWDCPIGILSLLTPTEYEYAKDWRKKCYEKHGELYAKRKVKKSLKAYAIHIGFHNSFVSKTTKSHIYYGCTPMVFATKELAEKQIESFNEFVVKFRDPKVVRLKRETLDSKWVIDESYS